MPSVQPTRGANPSDSGSSYDTAVKEHNEKIDRRPNADSTEPSTRHPIRQRLGLSAKPTVHDDHEEAEHQQLLWSRIRLTLREPFAEFWGTFFMVFFGNGSVAQVLLSAGNKAAPGADGYGQYQSISWGWGLGVMLGVYISGDAGGYLNPAITFSNCLYRGLPWKRFPSYLVAQFLGGFVASGVVYGYYYYAINNYEGLGIRTVPPSKTATAGMFCTYPQAFMSTNAQFWAETIESTFLMFGILALQDVSNFGAERFLPLGLFFLIFGLGASFGYETGYT